MLSSNFTRGGYPQDVNAPVRKTDSDAAIARLSAVKLGYLRDPFIRFLVQRPHLQPSRPPLINTGTYVRSEAIDRLVSEWLELSSAAGKKCQIVSMGAGSDTRFWRINTGPHKDDLATYVELDFAENTTQKAMSIRKNRELGEQLENVVLENGGTALHSAKYHLLPADLRIPPSESLAPLFTPTPPSASLGGSLLSPNLPTLLLFECVLVYVAPEASEAIIQWFVDHFASSSVLGAVVYEMFGLNDPFGTIMVENLKARGVSLPGAKPYPTFESLPQRFTRHNFTTSKALTLREIRKNFISYEESKRISSLEMLDEVEELDLVLAHYAVTWGLKLPSVPQPGIPPQWVEWGLKAPASSDHSDSDSD